MTLRALLVGCAMILASCAQVPQRTSGDAAPDYGPYPSSDYENIVKAWMKTNLRDPYSVQDLSISAPVRDRFWGGLLVTGGYVYAHRTCVRFNAKNAFGAYIGLRDHVFWIKNDQVIQAREERCS